MKFHEFILVRHGETVSNSEGRFQGSQDSPLGERGRADAVRLGDFFRENLGPVDYWFVSPYGRARDTSALIRGRMDAGELPEEEVDERLREIHCGSYERRLHAEVDQALLTRIRNEPDFPYPDGESKLDVAARAADFLSDFRARFNGNPERPLRVVVVAHGNLNQCMGVVLVGIDPLLASRSVIVNTGICRYYATDLHGPFRLRSWGETPHLDAWS